MTPVFFRQNKKQPNEILNLFPLSDQGLDTFFKARKNLYIYRNKLLDLVESSLTEAKQNDKAIDYKHLIKIKKKVIKNKTISITDTKINYKTMISYNNALEAYVYIKETFFLNHHQMLKIEKQFLINFFNPSDLILFRNNRVSRQVFSNNPLKHLTYKDMKSLYKFGIQASLKNVSFGKLSEIGLADSHHFIVPQTETIVKIQGYLIHRIFEKYFLNNLLDFQEKLYVNSAIEVHENFILFHTLLDNPEANIYRNIQRTVKFSNSSKIKLIINKKFGYVSEFIKILGEDSLRSFIELGIIFPKYNTTFYLSNFDNFTIKKPDFVNRIKYFQDALNKGFDIDLFNNFTTQLRELCDSLEINLFGIPPLTIDSYFKSNEISENHILNDIKTISGQKEVLKLLSQFLSLFDASTYIKNNVRQLYKNGFFQSLQDKNIFESVQKIGEKTFQDLNVGALRMGFFDSITTDNIDNVIDHIDNNDKFVFSKELTSKIISNNTEINSQYTFFLQTFNNQIIVNHIYKGYGVFDYRYHRNFGINKFYSENIEMFPIASMNYDFGFNANDVNVMENLDVGFPYFHQMNKNIRNLYSSKLKYSENENSIYLEDNQGKFLPSYLGSLTPMVLPKTLAILNSLTLSGSLFFDIGDLYIRSQNKKNPDYEFFSAPQISFLKEEIIISRRKKVFQTIKILEKLGSDPQYLDVVEVIFDLVERQSFFIKQFLMHNTETKKPLKPVYIDLRSIISVNVLQDYLTSVEWIEITDPIPEFSDSPVVEFIKNI